VGSLIAWGAVGGIGEGIVEMSKQEQQLKLDEKKTARDIQLQRMRDKEAMGRQRTADAAATKRAEAEWGPEGYRQTMERVKATTAETAAQSQHGRNLEIEEMRQKAQTAREQMRITENTPEFSREVVEETDRYDPMTGTTTHTPRQEIMYDLGGSYVETATGVKEAGQVWVPQKLAPPSNELVKAGMDPNVINWLISAPSREIRESRKFTFLQTYGFLPQQYFSAYDPRSTRVTERGATTQTTPAN